MCWQSDCRFTAYVCHFFCSGAGNANDTGFAGKSVIQSIAERRIEESMAKGGFDDLPGRGKPLELEDDSHVPPELRMAYKVLRNAGCVPPELAERKEISNLADMLEHCEDEQERVRQMQKLRFMILQARMKHQRPLNLDDDTYYDRLLERLSRHDRKK